MGIQDDYFDMKDFLETGVKSKQIPEWVLESYNILWDRFCKLEREVDNLSVELEPYRRMKDQIIEELKQDLSDEKMIIKGKTL